MLKNRVLAGWIIAFALGAGIGMYTDGKIRIIGFALTGVLCGLLLAAHRFSAFNVKKALVICTVLLLGMTYSAAYTLYAFSGSGEFHKKTDTVTARVKDIGSYSDGGYYDISVRDSKLGLGSGTDVRLYYTENPTDQNTGNPIKAKRGDILTCTVIYRSHGSKSLFSRSIFLTAQGSVDEAVKGSGILYGMRENANMSVSMLFRDYPDRVSGIAKTLITGESSETDAYIYALFRNAGISHLLVISGLHITMIIMSLYGIMELLTVRRQIRSIICLLALLGYAFFVGFTPSVSRAVIMTGLLFLTMLTTRRADSITSLFIAFFVILLINPYALFSIGTGLSFLSCLGILIVSPHLLRPIKGKRIRIKRAVRIVLSPLIFSLVATVFSFPVILFGFDSISYASPLVNLIVGPLFTWFLIILLPSVIIFSLIGVASAALSFLPGHSISLLVGLLDWLYERDIGSFSAHIPYLLIPLAFALAIIASLCFLRRKRMYAVAGALLICFIASTAFCVISFNTQSRNSTAVAVKDSFAYKCLFVADGKETIYIDLGGARSGISTVYRQGYCRLDYYVMNGLTLSDLAKLEAALAQINISAVYIPEVRADNSEHYERIKRLAKERGCAIMEYENIIFENIGRTMVTIKSDSDRILARSFAAVLERSGKSIAVYGGERLDYHDYELDDAVVLFNDFDNSTVIYCDYLIVHKDKKAPPESIYTEAAYDFSETDYAQLKIKNKSIEVSLIEP